MDAGLSASLRRAVYDWLDAVERLVALSDVESLAVLARTEMVRLAQAWRELLVEHEPDENGRCRTCPRLRRGGTDRCGVWVSAHRLLIAADLPASRDWRHAEQEGTAWSGTTTIRFRR
jgi:hypothetical protein